LFNASEEDSRPLFSWPRISAAVVAAAMTIATPHAQDDARKTVDVAAKTGAFTPATIEVRQNDLVHVTFTADDEPHAFMIDAYRIAKRAVPGRPSTFEFRADRLGAYPYYCSLVSASGQAHDERGELTVRK
jgi:heme/copper-type cytochrome/quinol oxidase subunit 2